jgi:predicted transglutaminase-like cysteine proteinase
VTDVAEDGVHRTLPLPPVSPDVFGTVAVPVSKTRMDDRWVRVSRPVEDSSLRELATSAAGLPRRQQASFVQAIVNRTIRYSSDQENWGQADYWATIEETLHRGAGDCEDIAVMKMHALRQLGFDDKDLYLVVGSDDAGRSHALLIVNLENDFIVLDDRAGRVLKADEVDGFRPILSFGSGMSWVHGTRIGAASPSQ